ncbi:LytTR family DNA-binding domain-containing protein [Aquimarina litoralis]|uniref:LytTR family DNA-binding domain-containing protein n=1 Tax=Aquimarina litoralis TaxID=584605 RepID=A0ABN1IU42_9FLAO
MMYKTVIIDDEQLAIDVIVHYLERFSNFEIVKTFTDAVNAFQYLKLNNQVDIVFTDIAMPEISGVELIKLTQNATTYVMTTSFSEYAVESFDLNALDYLLKPISFERFSKTISRFENLKNISIQDRLAPSFFVKDGDDFIKVFIHEIDYIQGLRDYAKLVTGDTYCLALKTLKSIEQTLEPYNFIRIHKSYIVPLDKIKQYSGKSVGIGSHEIPVGSTYREDLKRYLQNNKL